MANLYLKHLAFTILAFLSGVFFGTSNLYASIEVRLQSSLLQDEAGGQLASKTYAYDAHGRLVSSTDARNGTSTVTYFDSDQIQST